MLKWEDVTRLATRLNGVPVLGCRPGSPAAVAGVQYGDILMAVNDMPTPDWAAYIEARALNRGRMRVEVFRAGETLVFELTLATPTEPVDPLRLLDELMESNLVPLMSSASRRESEPS
jgi:S1-C subfamily serine protease